MEPTALERAIASQPDELERLLNHDLSSYVDRLRACRRIWLVGTGTSQHAAEMGALLFQGAGIDARWSGSYEFARLPRQLVAGDAVIVISQSAQTAYVVAAREAAIEAGVQVLSITGERAGWPESIETVAKEQSETYTVSYMAALLVLCRLAHELGAEGLSEAALERVIQRLRVVVSDAAGVEVEPPERAILFVGNGAGAITAREGALKLREAARVLAEGYGGEYLLHGGAVPLRAGDALILIDPKSDPDGLLNALGDAARAEGIAVAEVDEPLVDHPVLSQLPLTARLQLLALRFSQARSTDPDRAIVGGWADESIWDIGRPA